MTVAVANTWTNKALNAVASKLYADHKQITSEDLRTWLNKKRVGKPAHPNGYGALVARAVSMKVLRPTKKTVVATNPTSRGRKLTVYTVARPKQTKVKKAA